MIVPEAYDSWYRLGMCYRRLGDLTGARNASVECIDAMKRWVGATDLRSNLRKLRKRLT